METVPIAREKETRALRAALEGHLPQSLFIWGPPSCGKTFVLNTVIESCAIRHVARINAIEIMCGRRPFFETLLTQLQGSSAGVAKCENLRLFVQQLRVHYRDLNSKTGKTIVIIDEAEALRDAHSDILNALVRLQELIQSNLCVVIFSSVLPPSGFSSIFALRSTPTIHFQQYTQDQLVQIITTHHAPPNLESDDVEDFTGYVEMVLNVFYPSCRDLRKLLRLVNSNWDSVARRMAEGLSLRQIWREIEVRFKEDFRALNSQFLPMINPESLFPEALNDSFDKGQRRQRNKSGENSALQSYDDIPKHTRLSLIGAYLATHNPPASDKRFFIKAGVRSKGAKAKHHKLATDDTANAGERSKGGRSFDQNRLKSIFGFLVSYCSEGSEVYEGSVDWHHALSSLVESKFLQSCGEDVAGNFKYRCIADYDFVLEVSKSVGFELNQFLQRLV